LKVKLNALLSIRSFGLQTFTTGVEAIEQEVLLNFDGCRFAHAHLCTIPFPFKALAFLFTLLDSVRVLAQGDKIVLAFEKNPVIFSKKMTGNCS